MSVNCFLSLLQEIEDIQFLILDEADELLTPNFKEQINRFLEECPQSKQMMLFSATMPKDIKDVVRRCNSYCCICWVVLSTCA